LHSVPVDPAVLVSLGNPLGRVASIIAVGGLQEPFPWHRVSPVASLAMIMPTSSPKVDSGCRNYPVVSKLQDGARFP